jgi:peptidoglycan-N-acetylglucosamine deacetylase
MLAYLRLALGICRATGTEPSFLLHPLDLLGGDQAPALRFFPGMDLTGRRKAELFARVMRTLGSHFRLVNMSTHARAILAGPALRTRPAVATAAAVAAPIARPASAGQQR